jgi:hypothetical protein
MFVCMFVPYALLYDSSDCDETSVSCCAHAREGLLITFFLLNLKTFTKSATFHETLNELHAMSALHLMYDVREFPARGRYLQTTPPCLNRCRDQHDNNHPSQAVV